MNEETAMKYLEKLGREIEDNPDFLPVIQEYMVLIEGFANAGLFLYSLSGVVEVMYSVLVNAFWLGYMRGSEGEGFELDPDVWGEFFDE